MKIKFVQTTGRKDRYELFVNLFHELGIRVIPCEEFEINLNCEEMNENESEAMGK